MSNCKWQMATVKGAALLTLFAVGGGCTRESVRLALESQQRADQVQQAVFDRQHDGLRILLYRDLVRQLESQGMAMTTEQRQIVNAAWNERDLIEFWAVQHERAKALRLMGVDAKLYSDQSVLDLMLKSLGAKAERLERGIASRVGAQAVKNTNENGG